MGKLEVFDIVLNNFQGVYYGGQNVTGHCIIQLNDEMSMRGVRMRFEGKANVHWTEQHTTGSGRNQHTVTRHYSASEKYFNNEVLLYGIWPSQGRDTKNLATGHHTFPFCFTLPPNLPTSFEGAHGYVRYSIKAIIDKPWKFDHSCKRPFTVNSILDLNADPSAVMPAEDENQKMICCLCCASGPIVAEFRLERRGYVPGEPIRLFADIKNNSNRKMAKSYIDLRMLTTFHATSKSRTHCMEVARVTECPIEKRQSFTWQGQQLVIPPLPPSYLTGCKIINIRYILQLNVDPCGPAFDLEVPLEVIIGTIPLRQVFEQHPPKAPSMAFPPTGLGFDASAGIMHPPPEGADVLYPSLDSSAPVMPPISIPGAPAPSYGECTLGKVNVKDDDDNNHTRGNLEFAPVYAYYDWGHNPTTMA